MRKIKFKRLVKEIELFIVIMMSIIIVIAILLPIVSGLLFGYTANGSKNQIKYTYKYINEPGFFCKNESDIELSSITINEAYNVIPDQVKEILERNWIIAISKSMPFKNDAQFVVGGVTYPNDKIVWIQAGSPVEVYIHEFGHVMDHTIGLPSLSSSFKTIYYDNWQTYIEYGKDEIDSHSVSTEGEFFASLFVEYCLHTEYLKENLYDGYQYFENLLNNRFVFTGFGRYLGVDVGAMRTIVNRMNIHMPYKKLNYVINDVENSVQNNENLNIDNYELIVENEWMSYETEDIINIMLDIIANPDNYPDNSRKENQYVIRIEEPWEFAKYAELLSFSIIYFGDENIDPIDINVVNEKYTDVIFKKDEIKMAEEFRQKSINKVEDILSNNIKEGTETELLIQISNFIIDTAKYDPSAVANTDSFWIDGVADCTTYSIVFKQFANRLGIPCDVICVEYYNGQRHMYNRVQLSNGTYRYYDLSREIVDNEQIDKSGFKINKFVLKA